MSLPEALKAIGILLCKKLINKIKYAFFTPYRYSLVMFILKLYLIKKMIMLKLNYIFNVISLLRFMMQ